MKTQNKLIYLLGLLLTLQLSSCTDPMNEVTEIDYARAFSPIELKATVRNQVNVELNWKITKAESYVVEVFKGDSLTFAGTPALTFNDIKAIDLPFTIEGLDGATQYSARVKGVLADVQDSKWSGVYFKTQSENIFLPFLDNDIQAATVTLRWTPSPNVTKITVEILDGTVITHTLSPAEVTAGTAEITELTGETEYIAKIFNNDLQRGRTVFTTLLDLGNAIAVHPTDDFVAMLAAANSGDAFALFPGTYGAADKFTVGTNVEIKAVYPNDKPVLNGYFSVENNSALLLKDLVVDGTGLADGNQTVVFATAGANYGAIKIEGCEIKNHLKGLLYLNVAATVDAFIVNNTIIHHVECAGGDFVDNRAGAIKELTLSNSTIYSSVSARDFIRYDNTAGAFPDISPVINVVNNTLDGVANNASRRLLYVRVANATILFSNTIVSNTSGNFSNQSATPVPTFANNNYFNAPALFTGGSETARFFDDSATSLDPGYTAAAAGNFKVSNQALIDRGVGDSRWLK